MQAAAIASIPAAAHHLARGLVGRAAMDSDVVYRRTWPSREAAGMLGEAGVDAALAWNGWLDSTLDLRDGLSVVEVFAPIGERAVLDDFVLPRQG